MHLDAAILCPGPSLAESWNRHAARAGGLCAVNRMRGHGYDLTIAVNAAAELMPADVWACGDPVAFGMFTPRGKPSRFSSEKDKQYPADMVYANLRPDPLRPSLHRTTFTLLAAMAYAVHAGASRVTLYGCDQEGHEDFAGRSCQARSPERWATERRQTEEWAAWMLRRGVRLIRAAEHAAIAQGGVA